jgi:hypothetical protein
MLRILLSLMTVAAVATETAGQQLEVCRGLRQRLPRTRQALAPH